MCIIYSVGETHLLYEVPDMPSGRLWTYGGTKKSW